jgi:DNA-binding NarL/FixJ family response regulator
MNTEPRSVALRMVIVDDSSHFLDAARNLLEHDGVDVVGVASTSAEAVVLAEELRPDVFLVDVDLGEESGFDLARRLADCGIFRVVLISAYPETELTDLIAASPVDGFVSKSELSASAVVNVLGNAAAEG